MTKSKHVESTTGLGRREFVKAGGAATFALAAGGAAPLLAQEKQRPNLLLILTDQQHLDSISAAGCPHLATPGMDWIVKHGAHFRLSYTSNPVCSPARASILTGRTSSETGVYTNGKAIRKDIPNLGQWLGEKAGYDAVYAGKWHLPRSYAATMPGFRVLHTGIGGQGNLCDSAVSLACEGYLRNRSPERPFLMVASFMQPHDICEWLRLNIDVPKQPHYPEIADEFPPLPANHGFPAREPESILKRRQTLEPAQGQWTPEHWRFYRWSYYRHVEMVDGEIQRLLRALEETGQQKNTLVLLTADHGEGMGHHQLVRKSSPYDEAARVPFVIALPGAIPAGRDDAEHLVSGLDVMPTFCAYAGVAPPPKMRGRNLRPLLEGQAAPARDFVVTEMNNDTGRMLRTPRYKYVRYIDDPNEMLFDMRADPGETKNLAQDAGHKKALDEHRHLLREWEQQLDLAPDLPKTNATWRA